MKHTLLSAAFATMLAVPALANDYMIMAPAAPGGGWDGTARAMQEVMHAEGLHTGRVADVARVVEMMEPGV